MLRCPRCKSPNIVLLGVAVYVNRPSRWFEDDNSQGYRCEDCEEEFHTADSTDKEQEYTVTWEIQVYGVTPEEAAKRARHYQTKPGTTATVFDCTDQEGNTFRVDLFENTVEDIKNKP